MFYQITFNLINFVIIEKLISSYKKLLNKSKKLNFNGNKSENKGEN